MVKNMINKKKIIVLFLFVFSLSMIMGSVNATTLNPSDNVKTIVESAVSGSVINLNPNNGEFNLNSEIEIENKVITIKSSSSSKNAIINLNKKSRAFYIGTDGKLTLINVTIKNGMVNKANRNSQHLEGGAIRNWGTLTLTGCTFIQNTASTGGAICDSGTLTLSDCTFTQNTASGSGGAIYSEILTAKNCNFNGNNAKEGGAIKATEKTTLTSCTFTKNTASSQGGAIYSNWYGVSLTINTGTFTQNTATQGGAIYIHGDFQNAPFGSVLTVNKCTFTQNSAIGFGGILYNSYLATFTGCTFIKNTGSAGDHNGAFYKDNPNCVTNLNGCTFSTGTTGNTVANTAKSDLKITKITKKGNTRYVFVKNIGKKSAGKNTLGVYIGKTLIKKVSVKAIGIGKTLKVTVAIPKKYATKKFNNQFKTFKVDIKNVVKESNKNNNSFKAK